MLAIGLLPTLSESAIAGTTSAESLGSIVSVVAGRPVNVSCAPSEDAWLRELEQGQMDADAVAYYDGELDVIHFGPAICGGAQDLDRGVTPALVASLFVAAHEAAHAVGVDDEGGANCWGLYWAQDLARRFAGIQFFTPASRLVLEIARQIQHDAPPEYRSACPV